MVEDNAKDNGLGYTFKKTVTSPIAKAAKKIDKAAKKMIPSHSSHASISASDDEDTAAANDAADADEWADAVEGHHNGVPKEGEGGAAAAPAVPAVPPDSTLTNMDVFIKDKKIRGVTIKDYYDAVWSENDNANKPFYAPWLAGCGKMNVSVGGWEKSGEGGGDGFVGEWDGETYEQKRVVFFTTERSGIGPSTADVTQTQLCRVEGADKCVVALTINMKVPFGDCFAVEVRWVASRSGANNVSVSSGMLINFKKSCLVEGKIRANTTKETKKGQTNLFENIELACRSVAGVNVDVAADEALETEEDEEEKEQKEENEETQRRATVEIEKPCWGFMLFGKKAHAVESLPMSHHDEDHYDIVRNICGAHHKLGRIHDTICSQKSAVTSKKESMIRSEMSKVNDTLAKLVKQLEE